MNNLKDDFYSFINKDWMDNINIPDDKDSISIFSLLDNKINRDLLLLIKNLDNNNIIKIIYEQYYDKNINSCSSKYMDPLFNIINMILSCNSYEKLFNLIIKIRIKLGINLLLNINNCHNSKNSSEIILLIDEIILGLPDRDYYFNDSNDIISSYINYINEIMTIFNKKYYVKYNKDIYKASNNIIFSIEKLLAFYMHTKDISRDPILTNNNITYEDFMDKYKNLKFINYIFKFINESPYNKTINISNPNLLDKINNLILKIKLDHWKQYIIFKLINSLSDYLDNDIKSCTFNFYKNKLLGIKKEKPLWNQSLICVKQNLCELLSKYYSEKYYTDNNEIFNMITNIKKEVIKYIKDNDWMEYNTKLYALKKAINMKLKIGRYEKIYKLFNINVSQNYSLLENIFTIKNYNSEYNINLLYKPYNNYIWHIGLYEVNAYYSPSLNEFVIPAGILQEPFYSTNQSVACNYGGIGMIIGHEIVHAFDDQGSKYDYKGNLKNWWSNNDQIKYEIIIKNIINQYNNYKVLDKNINGKITICENIADICGLQFSLSAFKNNYKYDNNDLALFFINYSNIWKSKITDASALNKLIVDVHSPPKYRVNGALSHINDFYKIFNIKSKNLMYLNPKYRINIIY